MNPRVNELFSKTTLHRNDHTKEQRIAEITKFSELIIQECEYVITDQLKRDGKANDIWDRGYISGMASATRYIKEHFDVK